MQILAIETSCDETGLTIAEVEHTDTQTLVTIHSNALLSQALLHARYGGVYPTLAKREHAKNLTPLLIEALREAGHYEETDSNELSQELVGEIKDILVREPELFVQLIVLLGKIKRPNIDAIAVTHGPGLEPALWVGVNFAKVLSLIWDIPIIPTNHMEGHIVAALASKETESTFLLSQPYLPALAILISGGHTELVLMKDWLTYEKIGYTRDDAIGEAFDKSARLLGLPYPGGPEISKLAHAAREESLEQPFSLPRPMLKTQDYDFSFSGLKTAVRNLIEHIGEPSDKEKKQIARELEDAISDVLITKTQRAIDKYGIKTLIVGGGVSANTHIRSQFESLAQAYPTLSLFLPTPDLSTDNGVMIALAASLRAGTHIAQKPHQEVAASGNLKLY